MSYVIEGQMRLVCWLPTRSKMKSDLERMSWLIKSNSSKQFLQWTVISRLGWETESLGNKDMWCVHNHRSHHVHAIREHMFFRSSPLWLSFFPRQWCDWLKEVQLQILMSELKGTRPWSLWPPAFHVSIQEARVAQRRNSAARLRANLHASSPPYFCSLSSCPLLKRRPSTHSTNSAIIVLCNLAKTIMLLFNMWGLFLHLCCISKTHLVYVWNFSGLQFWMCNEVPAESQKQIPTPVGYLVATKGNNSYNSSPNLVNEMNGGKVEAGRETSGIKSSWCLRIFSK